MITTINDALHSIKKMVELELNRPKADENKYNIGPELYFTGFRHVALHGYIRDLNVYCSVLKPVSVGNMDLPLLRSVPIRSDNLFGDYVDYEPHEREYNLVKYNEFDQIEIDIKDDENETIDFKFGKVYVTLHFRKVRDES